MRKVLVVAYYFPPIGGIGSIRLSSFVRHLPGLGWQPIVLAPSGTPHTLDPGLDVDEHVVARARSFELSRARAVVRGSGAGPAGESSRVATLARRLAHRYLYFPDAQIGWYPAATAVGLRLLARNEVDAVYSSAFPVTAHLVARTLTRRFRVPWVAEYRDPWSEALPADHPQRARAARLEARLAARADAVVMTSPSWAAYFGDRWSRPVDVVPNGFDDALPDRFKNWTPPRNPVVTHLGSYYPGRQSFGPIWRALAALPLRPRIRFVGELSPAGRAEIAAAGLDDELEVTGFVAHEQAIDLLAGSSLLLAAGPSGTSPLDRGWVSAKLFEYLATPLPILFVGDPATDAGKLLTRYPGCHVVSPTDLRGAEAALRELTLATRYDRSADELSRRARATELAAILDRSAGRASASLENPA